MEIRDVLATKRDGGVLSKEEIGFFIKGYTSGEIEEYHTASLLTSIYIHGMQTEELCDWTHAMLHSGRVIQLDGLDVPTSDKHSTGGIGDKASIPLAPAVAACGVAVPMISGRGLGHTGGTLDKLESIPGFRTDLDEEAFRGALTKTRVAFAAQTADLVPADRKLYALRDVTGLVSSIPLIASSIMSKKLAEGTSSLVLDVKFGSGAFLPEVERGRELGQAMIDLAQGMGVKARVIQTAMDRPLGLAIGHTLEILESLECLRGAGPPDLRELVCVLGGEMLQLAGIVGTEEEGESRIARALDDGSAFECLEAICTNQGGTPGKWFCEQGDPGRTDTEEWRAAQAGHLQFTDLRSIGYALVSLGGGRRVFADKIDPGVGFQWHVQAGEKVNAGQALCTIHHRAGHGLEDAKARLAKAVSLVSPFEPAALILARV
ncbi:MAG: pyrimidine-nucleoside phosphorylase [Planctomycetota bacterium]|jgi:pyrimidine-nucleoside phosphorylase